MGKFSVGALLGMMIVAGWAPTAAAEKLQMVCKNPHQEYLVTFDTASQALVVNPDTDKTRYSTLVFENSPEREAAAGLVGNGSNLGFSAEFRPAPKVRYFAAGRMTQMDPCHDTAIDLMPPTKPFAQ